MNNRVESAYQSKWENLKDEIFKLDINHEAYELFLSAYKKEKELEVWIKPSNSLRFQKIKTYSFCKSSGKLGPKRKEGDLQIPEGIYFINRFNENSKFHLSLGINYPNKADLVFADQSHPGSDIFIHGGCETVGCIPITDDKMNELFILALEAKNGGQTNIPIHIFPFRFSTSNLEIHSNHTASQNGFWDNLKIIHDHFKDKKELPKVAITPDGKYAIDNN